MSLSFTACGVAARVRLAWGEWLELPVLESEEVVAVTVANCGTSALANCDQLVVCGT